MGDKVDIRPGATIGTCSNVYLGNNLVLRPDTILMATKDAGIHIEDDVLIGSGVHIYVNNHKYTIRIYLFMHKDTSPLKK